MNERDTLFLVHVLEATADIETFTVEGREVFMSDRKTQSAVIRQLEIIGEAVKNLSPALTQSEPTIPGRQIAGARDRLIHARVCDLRARRAVQNWQRPRPSTCPDAQRSEA